jgi:hypothetical protein
VFYILFGASPALKSLAARTPHFMRYVAKKHHEKLPGMGQHGRSRKLAEWQRELVTSLESHPEVQFRRVRSNELVIPGDFIKDGEQAYQPWDGPRGFRAASFHKPVFRPEPRSQM